MTQNNEIQVGDKVRILPFDGEGVAYPTLHYFCAGEVGTVQEVDARDNTYDVHVEGPLVSQSGAHHDTGLVQWCRAYEVEKIEVDA